MINNKELFRFIAIVIGIAAGIFYMSSRDKNSNFEDAALGNATVSYFAKDSKGNSIHYLPKKDPEAFLDGIKPYIKLPKVLFLGNSQSHSINQIKSDDNTMSGYLFEELLSDSLLFLSSSIPNANLQEHYFLFNYFIDKLEDVKLLVLPVFMDDLRETGIREKYFSPFKKNGFILKDTNQLAVEINQSIQSFTVKTGEKELVQNSDFNALDQTVQESVERAINKKLSEKFKFWENRKQIRGEYFTFLYQSRNTLFDISSQTKRAMISFRYKKNLNALNLILEKAKQNDIKILLLIPPLRMDIDYPYIQQEYVDFKDELNVTAKQSGVRILNIEKIVPGEYWGYSAPTKLFQEKDYDFMHFQAMGHKIMTDSLKPVIKELVFNDF